MNDALETCRLNNPDDGFGALECVAGMLGTNADVVNNRMDILSTGVDAFFLLFAAIVMFAMQAGFAMLCAGSVRRKNVQNTLLKNLLDACGCSVAFFVCGTYPTATCSRQEMQAQKRLRKSQPGVLTQACLGFCIPRLRLCLWRDPWGDNNRRNESVFSEHVYWP